MEMKLSNDSVEASRVIPKTEMVEPRRAKLRKLTELPMCT
jgi:hypothetical protein